jgi:hypothetical protein
MTINAEYKPNFPRSFAKEHFVSTRKLQQISLFPRPNFHINAEVESLTLFIQFRSINFEKKRALAFFLAVELLTSQKSVAVLSSRPVISIKIRKGILVGCRVTLRKDNFFDFIDLLGRTIPRRESFKVPNTLTRFRSRIIAETTNDAVQKSLIQIGRRKSESQRRFSSSSIRHRAGENFVIAELPLFPPFEIGLGLHPDISFVNLSFNFTVRTVEERAFILRSIKIPAV